jgi:hypothetical protein
MSWTLEFLLHFLSLFPNK